MGAPSVDSATLGGATPVSPAPCQQGTCLGLDPRGMGTLGTGPPGMAQGLGGGGVSSTTQTGFPEVW